MIKKVGLYIHCGDSYTGGPRVVENFARNVDRRRIDLHVITNKEGPLTRDLRELNVEYDVVPAPALMCNFSASSKQALWKLRSVPQVLSHNRKVAGILQRENCGLLWSRNAKGCLLTGLAARRIGIPLIWDVGMESAPIGLSRWIQAIAFRLSTIVVTESNCVAEQLFCNSHVQKFKEKVRVVHSGLPQSRVDEIANSRLKAKQIEKANFKITNLATICDRKNQNAIIEGLQDFLTQTPDAVLQIVGYIHEPEYFEQLKKTITSKGLSKQIEFLGWRDDAIDILCQSDVFVIGSKIEGVPYSVMEAINAEVPVVSTRCGGVPDLVIHGETGFLVEENHLKAFSQSVSMLYRDRELREKLTTAAKRHLLSRHTFRKWIESYTKLLENCVQPTCVS